MTYRGLPSEFLYEFEAGGGVTEWGVVPRTLKSHICTPFTVKQWFSVRQLRLICHQRTLISSHIGHFILPVVVTRDIDGQQ